MLVLSRHSGERIVIGEDITIQILEVRRADGRVRVGIVAPDNVTVHREEIYLRERAKQEALQAGPGTPRPDGFSG